jgi:transcriptional regulator with XRE-family HTH domain
MTLRDWLAVRQVSIPAFAVRIGRSPEAVRRYANGDRIPDKETMPLIAAETEGAVTANDFFGIETNPTDTSQSEAA